MLLGICRPPKSISQQYFIQNLGANRVNYGKLENRELQRRVGHKLSLGERINSPDLREWICIDISWRN